MLSLHLSTPMYLLPYIPQEHRPYLFYMYMSKSMFLYRIIYAKREINMYDKAHLLPWLYITPPFSPITVVTERALPNPLTSP